MELAHGACHGWAERWGGAWLGGYVGLDLARWSARVRRIYRDKINLSEYLNLNSHWFGRQILSVYFKTLFQIIL